MLGRCSVVGGHAGFSSEGPAAGARASVSRTRRAAGPGSHPVTPLVTCRAPRIDESCSSAAGPTRRAARPRRAARRCPARARAACSCSAASAGIGKSALLDARRERGGGLPAAAGRGHRGRARPAVRRARRAPAPLLADGSTTCRPPQAEALGVALALREGGERRPVRRVGGGAQPARPGRARTGPLGLRRRRRPPARPALRRGPGVRGPTAARGRGLRAGGRPPGSDRRVERPADARPADRSGPVAADELAVLADAATSSLAEQRRPDRGSSRAATRSRSGRSPASPTASAAAPAGLAAAVPSVVAEAFARRTAGLDGDEVRVLQVAVIAGGDLPAVAAGVLPPRGCPSTLLASRRDARRRGPARRTASSSRTRWSRSAVYAGTAAGRAPPAARARGGRAARGRRRPARLAPQRGGARARTTAVAAELEEVGGPRLRPRRLRGGRRRPTSARRALHGPRASERGRFLAAGEAAWLAGDDARAPALLRRGCPARRRTPSARARARAMAGSGGRPGRLAAPRRATSSWPRPPTRRTTAPDEALRDVRRGRRRLLLPAGRRRGAGRCRPGGGRPRAATRSRRRRRLGHRLDRGRHGPASWRGSPVPRWLRTGVDAARPAGPRRLRSPTGR